MIKLMRAHTRSIKAWLKSKRVQSISQNKTKRESRKDTESNLKEINYYYWSLLYSAILRSRADSLRSHVILHEWTAFYSAFFFFFWISNEVVYLHGWCHKKLLPSRRVLCTPYNHAPCHFMQNHIRKVYACFSCNLPPALLAEWPGSFTCYCSNTGVERIPK